MAADEKLFFQLAVKQHRVAIRAFFPEIVWNLSGLADHGAKFRADEASKPVHDIYEMFVTTKNPGI